MKGLRGGTAWLGGAQAGRLALQSVTFVLVARTLGAHGFGAFAASLALVSIISPFAAMGAGNMLVMHVARRPESFATQWGAVLLTVPVVGIALLALMLGVGTLILPVPFALLLLVALAELFGARMVDISSQAFQGFERARVVAAILLLQPAFRVCAAVTFVATGSDSPVAWGVGYLVGSAAAAVAALSVVTVLLGRPRHDRGAVSDTIRNGAWFALAQSFAHIYTDIDKALLARLGTLSAAGIYAVAYRMTALAFTPISGLLAATYARFFKRGQTGIHGSRRFAVELLPAASLYGAAAGIGLWFVAPVLPHVLGSDYATAVGALRWLAPLPLIQALFYLGGDALTGAGHQRLRTALQLGAAAANALLCLWLIPAYSWRGAAWATLIALGLLAASMWTAVMVVSARKERHGDASPQLAGLQA